MYKHLLALLILFALDAASYGSDDAGRAASAETAAEDRVDTTVLFRTVVSS